MIDEQSTLFGKSMGDSDIYQYESGQKTTSGYRSYQKPQDQPLFTNSLILKQIVGHRTNKSPAFKKDNVNRTPDRVSVSMREDSLKSKRSNKITKDHVKPLSVRKGIEGSKKQGTEVYKLNQHITTDSNEEMSQ